jgi:hypothetical protein
MITKGINGNVINKTRKLLAASKRVSLPKPVVQQALRKVVDAPTLVGIDGSQQKPYFRQPPPDEAAFWAMMDEDIQLSAAKEGSIPKYRS